MFKGRKRIFAEEPFTKTAILVIWEPTFQLSETGLIPLRAIVCLVLLFVQPLPHKRCEAGLTNNINVSSLFRAELCQINSVSLSPDYIGVMSSGIFIKYYGVSP